MITIENPLKKCNYDEFERIKLETQCTNAEVKKSFGEVVDIIFATKPRRLLLFNRFILGLATDVPIISIINEEWICEMVKDNLAKFFSSNGGWVCSSSCDFTSSLQ